MVVAGRAAAYRKHWLAGMGEPGLSCWKAIACIGWPGRLHCSGRVANRKATSVS